MVDEHKIGELEKKLLEHRKKILVYRDSLNLSWKKLQGRENEIQEMAGKETLREGLERFDHRVVNQLKQIDIALTSIKIGIYGRCDICLKPIPTQRLYAIPWARKCKKCAQNEETVKVDEKEAINQLQKALSDTQDVECIRNELDTRDNLDTKRLKISCYNGTVYLSGSMPTKKQYQLVLEIIDETLGFEGIMDCVNIDELNQSDCVENSDDQAVDNAVLMEGEPVQDDPYHAIVDNESMIPPDSLSSEDER